ncbi:MAG: MBL fold metallo-hydrolase [Deltaproteobacteria bacterium]|nr:MBL fold metallo-hydrolase [Deltaproteobacteria bacterium]
MFELITSHAKSVLPGLSVLHGLPGLVVALLCAAFCLIGPSASLAAEPAVQVGPIWSSGAVSVLTIQDVPGDMSVDIFSGPASQEERAKYFQAGKAPAGVNAFLIQVQGQAAGEKPLNMLVDAGFGMAGASKLMQGLAAAGVAPEQVDFVLLTHMHGDHIGGLLSAEGQRVFPNAGIMVARIEKDYWTGKSSQTPNPENAALATKVLEAYSSGLPQPFEFGKLTLPALTAKAGFAVEALDASGHTPGHTVFMLDAAGQKLMIIGDLVHAAALQFALPEECARYDVDVPQAVKARKRILALAAEQEIEIAGMHIPFPGNGKVAVQFRLLH